MILVRAHSRFFSGHPLSRLLGGCGPDRFFLFLKNPRLTRTPARLIMGGGGVTIY
jgi:hypothetical protein